MNISKKYVTLKVHVCWKTESNEYPDVVYLAIPEDKWNDDNYDFNLSGELERYFDGEIDDLWFEDITNAKLPEGVEYIEWREGLGLV